MFQKHGFEKTLEVSPKKNNKVKGVCLVKDINQAELSNYSGNQKTAFFTGIKSSCPKGVRIEKRFVLVKSHKNK